MQRKIVLLLLVSLFFWTRGQSQTVHYIAFVSDRTGNEEIYIIPESGGDPVNLTQSTARDWHPDWSPDGRRIAFVSDREGSADLYIMNNNGTSVQPIAFTPLDESAPSWSPDGDRIVYAASDGIQTDLRVVDVETGQSTPLTTDGTTKGAPAWSPDGATVAYWQQVGEETHLLQVDVATGATATVLGEGTNNWPAWSPDGTTLVFFRIEGGVPGIFTMPASGGTPQAVTTASTNDLQPAWSPDGTQLLYTSSPSASDFGLYIVPATGGTPSLFVEGSNNHSASWQPMPAPVDLLTGVAALVSGYNVVREGDISENEAIGDGEVRVLAPEIVSQTDAFRVRLELDATSIDTGDPVPTPTPNISMVPTATPLPERVREFIGVYEFMGAELTGLDLSRFAVDPDPTNYVLRVRPGEVNYWEWTLRPLESIPVPSTNLLRVSVYVPRRTADGTLEREIVLNADFDIQVLPFNSPDLPDEPPPPPIPLASSDGDIDSPIASNESSEEANDSAPQSLGLILLPDDNANFTVIFNNTLEPATVLDLSLNSEVSEFRLEDVSSLTLLKDSIPAGTCVRIQMHDATGAALPSTCDREQLYPLQISLLDVFWYDHLISRPVDTALRSTQTTLGICKADMPFCRF